MAEAGTGDGASWRIQLDDNPADLVPHARGCMESGVSRCRCRFACSGLVEETDCLGFGGGSSRDCLVSAGVIVHFIRFRKRTGYRPKQPREHDLWLFFYFT